MEVCDTLRKSVLKKPCSPSKQSDKRVTFCGTVKLFIDNPDGCGNSNERKTELQSKCIEISIVDKSSCEPFCVKSEECSEKDFLVHKVVYEEAPDQREECETDSFSEDTEDSSILFDVSSTEESLEFVVHKVTDHEDDLIQQELALDCLESNFQELDIGDGVRNRLSELSIENILTHDKIIAFIDQKSLSLASLLREHVKLSEKDSLSLLQKPAENELNSPAVSSTKEDSKLVLSPPLQELGLDKIVKAQSDDILYELDISPLNSIQESDSESDLSSEGTMIMMTSEESEKNELHIQESLLKYQSLLQEKMKKKTESVPDEPSCDPQNQNSPEKGDVAEDLSLSTELQSEEKLVEDSDAGKIEKWEESSNSFSGTGGKISNTHVSISTPVAQATAELHQLGPTITKVGFCDDIKNQNASIPNSFSEPKRKESLNVLQAVKYWDKALESVEIPKDVREWKIRTVDDLCHDSKPKHSQNFDNPPSTKRSSPLNIPAPSAGRHSPRSDELENFVHASTERVQRIRRRYLVKPKAKPGLSTTIRGIRPKFCTTAEILQMLEEKNQPPFIAFSSRDHVSWPCHKPAEDFPSSSQFPPVFACHIVPGDCSLRGSFRSQSFDDSFSSSYDHDSVSSCPSVFFQERGVPEGASPPRSLNSYSVESYTSDDDPSNVVYFSMKV